MPTVLITGANRGIGLEFAQQYMDAGWRVVGTVRDRSQADRLAETRADILSFDAADDQSAHQLAKALNGLPIDVLIANAGISGNFSLKPEEITREGMLEAFSVNTFSPLQLASAMHDNLLRGDMKIACAVSSILASITANDLGTHYVYRATKTALNAAWSALARERRSDGITCVLIRPGYVKTRMTNFQGIEPSVSVEGMRRVIAGLTIADTGRFIGYDGAELPW
jgi:NAD(P)-dependent dehydrogenase (short-subunit alcohol dehydrogenase family)